MEFVSPTKWPNLKIKAGGFPCGLGTLRDAEPRNADSGAPGNITQRAVGRMLGRGETRGQHCSLHETMWRCTGSGAWCLGMKQMHSWHFGKRGKKH